MDALNDLKQFYEKIITYQKLVRQWNASFIPSAELREKIQSLRTELQRGCSRLENTITQYSGTDFNQEMFYTAFDTFTGYTVGKRLLALNKLIPIVNKAIGKLEAQGKSWKVELPPKTEKVTKQLSKGANNKPKAFISHGKGGGALLKLEKFIKELGIEPIIVKDRASADRTVDAKVTDCLKEADFVIIFATGDDEVKVKGSDKGIFQPRQNVIHEIGLAQTTHPGKIIYLLEERAQFPSNIKPKVYEGFARNSLDDAFTAIVRELKHWGFLKVGK